VAEVRLGSATRYGALTYNGEFQVSGAVVLMLKGENSNEVIKNIKQRIEEIKKTLPEGIIIEPFIDRTKMVNNAISTVTQNLIEGALIVIFVLVLFLGNIRAGILVASVIPLSMLFAIILMNLFGVSGNLMSLGALDFGLIVDGAVIIVEAVMHQLSHSKYFKNNYILSQEEMNVQVNYSASRMMNSAVFGQIIILIVYLPIFTLQGIEGKMFKPMAQTVAFALAGAFLLSLTYIPMMSSLVLSKSIKRKLNLSDKFMNLLEQNYQTILVKVLRYQKVVLLIVILLFTFSCFILSTLGGEFIPSLPEGDFAVEVRILPGSNLNASIDAASKASKLLMHKFHEIERIVTKTGSSEVPTDPMPLFASDMIIVLKNRSKWTNAKTYEQLEAKMINELKALPGISFSFQFPVAMRFNELISGAKQDVVCKIFGDNLDTLAFYANKLGMICNSIEGSSGLYVETVSGLPQITIKYNREAIAQYGLNISDINNVINTAFAGGRSGIVYESEKRFDLVVRLKNEKRKDLYDVHNLLVPTPNDHQIPLNTIANVEIAEGPNQIQREDSQRRTIVGFNVRGRDVQSMVLELQKKVENQIKLPSGYYITYGGAFENLQAAKERLYVAVPVSLALIFLLLFFAFRSVKQGLLIYSAIPLSAIGGILALAVRGISFSISAGVGFIALFGVAVLNGIVLIAEFNRLKSEGFTNLKRIVIQGTKVRLRPVLMTAFVASLGFLPMAFSTGEGAEVQRPLATVVIGGLLIATLLTLFVLPILYLLFLKKTDVNKKVLSLIVLFLVISLQEMNAQFVSTSSEVPITLKQSVETALLNNLSLKNDRLKTEYQKKLINSGLSIPNTNLFTEYGQVNSFYNDTRLGISQVINFPTVYLRQKDLLDEEWKSSVLNLGVEEAKLKRQVTQLFYTLIYLQQKKELLRHSDSVYFEFLNKVKLRYDKGESNILENTIAENQRGQAALQLLQLKQDTEFFLMQFQLLLNTTTNFVPNEKGNLQNNVSITDTLLLSSHPTIQYWKQQQQLAIANTKLEISKLLPDIVFSYYIMGMNGTGADNKIYNNSLQFNSIQFGLSIPIFSFGQVARINAAEINETISVNNYELNWQNFLNSFRSTYLQLKKFEEKLQYFENTALKNADTITMTANQQFQNGDINYLEWVLLINQATTIYSDYIEVLKNKNIATAEINFYINK